MSLIYAVVSRGSCVLAEHSEASGNFAQISQSILEKIPTDHPQKLTYTHERFLFHYQTRYGIIYMCMADEELGRRIPFHFLDEVESRFEQTYGERAQTALPYGMNEFSRTLASMMSEYNSNPQAVDRIRKVQGEIDQVRDVMVQNIERVLERGERIEILVDKTDSLNQAAFLFKKRSTALKRQMWWKNTKLMIVLTIVSLISLYLIVCAACGFPGWSKCTG